MKKVSVFLITYNHEKYVAKAIESVIAQKVNFDFELIIGEDFSTDNTRAICEQYANKYPALIKLLPSGRNYGMMANARRILQICTGEYIAMCEGDDYWTDVLKLQKQVDFLDANPDFSICFSETEIIDELEWNLPEEQFYPKREKDTFTIEDFILSSMSIIPTATMLFRNLLPNPLPAFWEDASGGDIIIQLLIGDKGKARFMAEKMAVYRNHAGGITKSERMQLDENKEPVLKETLKCINEYLGFKYDKVFRVRFFEMSRMQLIYGARNKKGVERIKHYFKRMPDYIKYSDKINFKELIYYHFVLFFPSFLKLLKRKK